MSEIAYWFDLDGTLVHYDRPFQTMLDEAFGTELDSAVFETFSRRVFIAFDGFEEEPFRRGFEAIAKEHGIELDPVRLAETMRGVEIRSTKLVEGAVTTLESFNELGRVGILTNGDGGLQRAKLTRHGLDELVDAVVISNEVRSRKPDPGIFEAATERLPADTHVFVGDSFEEDVQGALDAGFIPVHVRNDDGPPVSIDTVGTLGVLLGGVEGH